MQQGWLSVVSDDKIKIVRLKKWIQEGKVLNESLESIRELRQIRLNLAQKIKQSKSHNRRGTRY